MQTYLFYDIETTGLNKSFDQIIQFAAIRTDLDCRELERYEINIQLNPDVIPSPGAVLAHHKSIAEITSGEKEGVAIKKIHAFMNTPGTISVGYNTLNFDDEFLRFSFYRNLLAPYTHQYANQCGRMDLYSMAVMYYLFKSEVIAWPSNQEKISLKLEALNNENKFISGRSHDAMIDVQITLELARCFLKEKDMWSYLIGYFNKESDQSRIMQLPTVFGSHRHGLYFEGRLGSDQYYQCPVLSLGQHNHYKNQHLWLRLDLEELRESTRDSISKTTWVIQKKIGEPGFLLPPAGRFSKYMDPARLAIVEKNIKWLQGNEKIFHEIIDYHKEFTYPKYPDTDKDAALYLQGFWSSEETRFCTRFHELPVEQKMIFIDKNRPSRMRDLAIRILGRLDQSLLTGEALIDFQHYMEDIARGTLIDYRGEKRYTPEKALVDIQTIFSEKNISSEEKKLLDELKNYIKNIFVTVHEGSPLLISV